jgi:glycosyltransferase involved in cell wall biosynthesis
MVKEPSNKILLITNIPTPYRIPLFNELHEHLKEKGLKFKVIFGALSYPHRKWNVDLSSCKFDFEVLPSRRLTLSDPEKVMFTYRGLLKIVKKEKPNVIITNAFSVATTTLWLMSWHKKIPYIIWSGAIEPRRAPNSHIKRIHRQHVIKRAAGFIGYGRKAKEYLINLGAKAEKIEIGINTVDTFYFQNEVEKYRDKLKRNQQRNRKKILLYVGYLVKRKRVDLMFSAIKILAQQRSDFILKIVGDGLEKENLVSLVDHLGISEFVMFEGFRQKEELIKYYAEADCFLFPTDFDIWGLVLVEAMAAGLPCIASIHAGATHDLIMDGVTGFAMDFEDPGEIVKKIEMILDDHQYARRIGEAASRFITKNASLCESAKGFIRAIEKAS